MVVQGFFAGEFGHDMGGYKVIDFGITVMQATISLKDY
jgi:hypothetical protein